MTGWKDQYNTGISTIDLQHRRLFQLIDELQAAIQGGLRACHIESLLAALEQYKTRHFNLEEQYMKDSGYPGIAAQRQAHATFTHKLDELKLDHQENGMSPQLVNTIRSELMAWVQDHVTGLDRTFGRYYQNWQK